MASHPSASDEQQEAGVVLVNALSHNLGVALESKSLELKDGCWVQIDGYSCEPPIICEAWAHIGKPRGGQLDKVMSDALKLVFCEQQLGQKFKKILLFSDEVVGDYFSGGNWQARCLKEHGIEVIVLPLPGTLFKRVKDAQRRQRMVNSEERS